MPSEETRKILRLGSRYKSSAVTLPKGWIEYGKMEPGEEVRLLYDGILVVIPPRANPEIEQRVRDFLERVGHPEAGEGGEANG